MTDRIENEVNRTLESISGLKKADSPDFFYTRLRARMQRESNVEKYIKPMLRPAILYPAFSVIILLNILTFNKLIKSKNSNSNPIENIKNDYNLTNSYGIELY